MRDVQEEPPEGPRLRTADQPNRARRTADWRQDAMFELEDLAELYGIDATEVRL